MGASVVLNELEPSKWIVNSFLLRGNILLIVEPELIIKGKPSQELINGSMTRTKTTGYTVAAQIYVDFVTNKEYLLILKDCGVLEVLDSELNRLDLLDISIDQTKGEKFFLLDDRHHRLYINLEKNRIYMLEFRVTADGFAFIRKDRDAQCVYESVEDISNIELSWHTNFETSRDYVSMSILLFNESSKQHYFEVIAQQQSNSRNKKQPWLSCIKKTLLELTDYPSLYSNVLGRHVAFKAVSNIGFFIFSLRDTFFFVLPGGSEHSLAGKKIQDYARYSGLAEHYVDRFHVDDIDIHPNVNVLQTSNFLEFIMCTNSNFLIAVKFDLVCEDPDELKYHWGSCVCVQKTIPHVALGTRPLRVRKFMSLNLSLCMFLTAEQGMIILDIRDMKLIHSQPYKLRSAFYSGYVGQSFGKYVLCGGSKDNTGFIEFQFIGYEDLLSVHHELSSTSEIIKMWSTEDSVWWLTADGKLHQNDQYIGDYSNVVHITMKNKLIQDGSIVSVADILNDPDCNYCYVTGSGALCWSCSEKSVPIKNFKSSSLVKYHLTSVRDVDGTNITVLAVDNVLTIVKNHHLVAAARHVSHEVDAISSIFIVRGNCPKFLLLGDIDGNLFWLDFNTLAIQRTVKVGCGRVMICGVPHSSNILINTQDDLLLLTFNLKGNYDLKRIYTKLSIKHLSARDGTNIDILTSKLDICSFKIPKEIPAPVLIKGCISNDTHFHSKFIHLPCSTRYIVTSSFRSEYSIDHKRSFFFSEIQLHDLYSKKTLCRYDISKKYPQAIISDIIAIPFQEDSSFCSDISGENSYAKRLTFGRCFIVSLNYETAEDDSELDNLLLFTMEDGAFDFHLGIRTGRVITALHNYYHYLFLTAGEVLQAVEIDYSVKENAFKIEIQSNPVMTSGFVKGLLTFESSCCNSSYNRGHIQSKHSQKSYRIISLNLFEGPQEFEVINNSCYQGKSSRGEPKFKISPVPSSQKATDFTSCTAGEILTAGSLVVENGVRWYAFCSADNIVVISRLCPEEGLESFGFKMPCEINNIVSLRRKSLQVNSTKYQKGSTASSLFSITTCKGGNYILSSHPKFPMKEEFEQKMDEQLEFIGVTDTDLNFVDTRVLNTDNQLNEIFCDFL